MDRAEFQRWLDRYVGAWRTNDPTAIGDLFSEDASYLWNPWDEPTVGRERIVQAWTQDPDPPGSWEASYVVLAVDGDVGVAQGRTHYGDTRDGFAGRRFDNIFLCRFDQGGRCREFTEWFMEPRRAGAAAD
jgi:ketosteroid isomerase-like protein